MMQNTVMEKKFESNHGREVIGNLNDERLSTAKFCDVTLEVGDRKVPVHKNILASISKYFENLFSTEMSEKYQKNIEIKEVKPDIFETIITFIYTTKITINESNVYDLLAAVNYMLVPHVKDYCTEFLLQLQNAENCLKIWETARKFDAKELETKSSEFLSKHFAVVITSSDMKVFDVETLKSILKHKCKRSIDQESAFKVIVEWVKHSRQEREKDFDELFHSLHLEYFTKAFLGSIVAEEELVENNGRCQKLLITALKQRVLQAGQDPDPATSFLAFNYNFTSLRLFDIANGVHKEIARRTEPLYEASPVAFDNFLYLVGGYTESRDKPTNAVHKISLVRKNAKWETDPPMQCRRFNAGIAACEESIWVFGGYNEEGKVWLVPEYFNTQMKLWTRGNVYCKEGKLHLVSKEGMLYAFSYQYRDCEKYDPRTREMRDVKLPENCVKALIVSDAFYVLCRESLISYVLKWYDTNSNESRDLGSLNRVGKFRDACVVNGNIVVAAESDRAPLSLYEFDFATNEWNLRWDIENENYIKKMVSYTWEHHFKAPA